MKSVDLVIPCYNEERTLAASVEKLHAWSDEHLPYKWRIVVADNASTDGTLAVAQQLAARFPDEVGYIHLDQKGRGRALKKAWLESAADALRDQQAVDCAVSNRSQNPFARRTSSVMAGSLLQGRSWRRCGAFCRCRN